MILKGFLLVTGLFTLAMGKDPIPDSGTYEEFVVAIGDRVFFDKNTAELSDKARQTLNAQAQWLVYNASYKIMIEGHADDSPDTDRDLSGRRAAIVHSYLANRGIEKSRLRTASYGRERRELGCSADYCQRENRRAVLRISK